MLTITAAWRMHVRTAESAFNSVGDLKAKLGAAMKPSKAQPPSTQHVIQGVLVKIEGNRAVVCATADRKAKLTSQVASILGDDCLTPQVAGVLAGKFGFVASSLYGQVARPVLRAIYMCQNAAGINRDRQALTPALRASLMFLVEVLTWAPPRQLDYAAARSVGIAYADALRNGWRAASTSRFPDVHVDTAVLRLVPQRLWSRRARHLVCVRGRP